MMQVAVYDSKPYDRIHLRSDEQIQWIFHEFRLNAATAATAKGMACICVFVNDQVDRECIQILKGIGVKLIALRCAGFNNVDLDAAREAQITVVRVPAYSPYAVAEHAVALLLTLNRKIHRAHNRVREHNFSLTGLVGFDLHGKTVGIIGTGKIGRIASQIFHGFSTRVIAYDPFPTLSWAEENGIHYVPMADLLVSSDIISLHVPLNPETFHLLNAETLDLLKPGAVLINTSRGKLIDTKALIASLKKGRLGGVGLDVYEEEEGVFFEDLSEHALLDDELSRLLTFPNVLVTSHQGFLTHEALAEIARVTRQNIDLFSRNEPFLEGTVVEK